MNDIPHIPNEERDGVNGKESVGGGDAGKVQDRERHERIFALFQRACDLDRNAQKLLLDRECVDDESLRSSVEEMLSFDDLEDDTDELSREHTLADTSQPGNLSMPLGLPDQIGRYRLLKSIGVGGMGVVYEAEQESPKRRIALKLLSSGMGNEARLTPRFLREGQIQAGLQHPGIVQVYETGTTVDRGRILSFIAMELVEGKSLLDYVQSHRLSLRDVIGLILKVCEAVGYAHQRGVIHRDLKPSNILVAKSAAGPVPKVLDFGIAKLTTRELNLVSMHTQAGQIIGTLAYMSPEQVRGNGADVDTRTDQYALGLILFQSLSGTLPYDISEMSIPEAARCIAEENPARLGLLRPECQGDLETIVQRATSKDKTARYDSVSEFAADLKRYLNDEPITARPPTVMYQFRKFAKRNKVLVSSIAVVVVTLVSAVVAMTLMTITANRARRIAEQKTAVSEEVSRVLLDAFTSVTPKGSLGTEPLLIDTVNRIETQIQDVNDQNGIRMPEVQAIVLNITGIIHRERGDFARAEFALSKALEIRKRVLDPRDPNLADSYNNMGVLLRRQERFAEAAAMYEKAVELQRDSTFRDDVRLARNIFNLASALAHAGNVEQAKSYLAESLALHQALPEVSKEVLAYHVSVQAKIARVEKRLGDALELSNRALGLQREAVGPDHPTIVLCLMDLAAVKIATGANAEAVAHLLEAQAMGIKVFHSESHPTIKAVRKHLIEALRATGQHSQADEVVQLLNQP